MSGDPRLGKPPPGLWERYWPRVLAVLQAVLGTYMILHEVGAQSPDATVLGFGILLVAGVPATVVAARILGGK